MVTMEDDLKLRANTLAVQERRRWDWRWLMFGALALLLLAWLNNTPAGLLGKADAVGYAVCHQIDARSFHLEGRAMPLCARCSGMYLGFITGLAFLLFTRRRFGGMPPLKILLVLGAFGVAFAVDGLNSYLQLFPGVSGLYEPNNTLRLFTGSGVGLAIAAVLYPAFIQTAFKAWQPQPAIGSFRQLGLLTLLVLGVNLLVLTENSRILYPLALLSAASVLVMLAMVYSMVLMMVFRLEGRIQHLGQLILPLTGGLFLGILQIALIDLGRFILTGTWDGFHLG
jgi:uncharacterized membrane protein